VSEGARGAARGDGLGFRFSEGYLRRRGEGGCTRAREGVPVELLERTIGKLKRKTECQRQNRTGGRRPKSRRKEGKKAP